MSFQRINCVRCDEEIEVVGDIEGLDLKAKCVKCLKQDKIAEAQHKE